MAENEEKRKNVLSLDSERKKREGQSKKIGYIPGGPIKKKTGSKKPGFLVYIQVVVVLALIAVFMKQCGI